MTVKLSQQKISRSLKYYFAGMTTICTHHILRYSLTIQFPRSGDDICTLQRIPGYSTLEMTRCHLKIANGDVEAKIKAFSPAEQLGVRPYLNQKERCVLDRFLAKGERDENIVVQT